MSEFDTERYFAKNPGLRGAAAAATLVVQGAPACSCWRCKKIAVFSRAELSQPCKAAAWRAQLAESQQQARAAANLVDAKLKLEQMLAYAKGAAQSGDPASWPGHGATPPIGAQRKPTSEQNRYPVKGVEPHASEQHNSVFGASFAADLDRLIRECDGDLGAALAVLKAERPSDFGELLRAMQGVN